MTRAARITVALHKRRAAGLKPVDYVAIALRAGRDADNKALPTKAARAQAIVRPMFAALRARQKRLKTPKARDREQEKLYKALDLLQARPRV